MPVLKYGGIFAHTKACREGTLWYLHDSDSDPEPEYSDPDPDADPDPDFDPDDRELALLSDSLPESDSCKHKVKHVANLM